MRSGPNAGQEEGGGNFGMFERNAGQEEGGGNGKDVAVKSPKLLPIHDCPVPNNGRFFKEFDFLQFIGAGGFGSVNLCRHKLDQSLYAVKRTMLEEPGRDLREVVLHSNLSHPNILRYYSSWVENDGKHN